ncbi:TetR/AcrR family transcriptional regulator [Symbiopectobacterium purcellii]|uniref:TetR family transcriptional regulator n=1 Tax=Symbiopectobacterium purcellii TaxID=2871826 RepID=A0ABX9AJR6_9ENTR|nr:TetR/AcrR family transcriptional regulator [Symbiopectobacterium purcellii]QZN95013.1 TetR family transcriptional regulator [Symbiopectobacterium purcellii]
MQEEIKIRKPRADALRNRQRLLDIAKVVFAEHGLSASLEEIARSAGVGIGTLYRHFPTREILINEIYSEQGIRLHQAALKLSTNYPPREAIRRWLLVFIDTLKNKQIMAGVLSCRSNGGDAFCALSGEVLVTAFDTLLAHVLQEGSIVQDIRALDILCAIAGIASYGQESEWEESAKRLVDVVLSGASAA